MLVVTREHNETICIGDDIVVTVVRISPTKVRIGIVAPRDMPVHRGEIKKRIDDAKKAIQQKPVDTQQQSSVS